mmetsp:Transcript_24825/g.63229  ORF Transcript_24825/g.63229 Transcript_24825/m.63229 type:complete len:158 (-) Transcript_24825:248-721(-)
MRSAVYLLALTLVCSQARVTEVKSDEAFEEMIVQSPDVTAVLFTSPSKEEEAVNAHRVVEVVASKLTSVQFAIADVDSVKAFASEFNVRRRMVPRLLVFPSRARQVDMIPMKGDSLPTADGLEQSILTLLAEHKKGENGIFRKKILSIGSGDDKQEV